MTETPPPNDEQTDVFSDDVKPKKEKLKSIMDAASALTSLCDEEEESGETVDPTVSTVTDALATAQAVVKPELPHSPPPDDPLPQQQPQYNDSDDGQNGKRYLPEHKKPDAAPTFPEKLMSLMRFAEQEGKNDPEYCIAWLPEGKSFVIRNPDEFSRNLVPKFFKQTKFSSFTRKLYRWGFRQINRGIGPDDPIIFGNEFFDRDNEAHMSKMRSITAAGTRKAEQRPNFNYLKRPHEGMYDAAGSDSKRMFFDQYMQHQKANLMHQNPSLYGGMSTNGMTPMGNFPMRQGGMGMEGHPMHPQQQQGPPMMMGHPQQGMVNGGAPGQPMNKPYDAAMMHQNAQYQQHMHMQNSQMMGTHQMYAMQPGMQQQQQMGMPQSHHAMQGMGHQGDQQGPHGNGMQQAMHGNTMQNMQGTVMQDNELGSTNSSSHHPGNGASASNGGNNASAVHGMTPNGQGSNRSGPGPVPGSGGSQSGGYPNPQSTAEIVNAAIAALRYSH